MKKICVLGAFGYYNNKLDGQTVKTRNVFKLLQDNHSNKLYYIDTMEIRRNPLYGFRLLWKLIKCNTLIIIPCLNNLTYIFPIVYYLSKILRFEVIHICIGGWQAEYFVGNERFKSHPLQLKLSKKIKLFMPEMISVENDLRNTLGFTNTVMFPNFRFISSETKYTETMSKTLRLVFLARVDKQKGYDTIFNFAEFVKAHNCDIIIDFYGPINEIDRDDFFSLLNIYKDIVSYKGVLQQEEIAECLKNYDLMLLPTKVYTEGFPGSILDAYIAGIPVIATKWKYAHEFIDDEKTGFIIRFEDCQSEFNDKVMTLYNDREMLSRMKSMSFQKRLQYSNQYAWSILSKYL